MGSSRVERDKFDLARELLELAEQKKVRFLLPIDLLGAEEIKPGAATRHSGRISPDYNIPDGWQAVDIGPGRSRFSRARSRAPRPSYGTGLPAFSRSKNSPPGPKRSPKRWPNLKPPRSSAAAIP
jgi:hypothetical protein